MSVWRKYGYLWVTLVLFLGSLIGHWFFGWHTYLSEQASLGKPPEFNEYLNEMLRDTLENWQSEFFQLIWQVAGLSFLLYVGSPASKDGQDRMEGKIDEILRRVSTDHEDRNAL